MRMHSAQGLAHGECPVNVHYFPSARSSYIYSEGIRENGFKTCLQNPSSAGMLGRPGAETKVIKISLQNISSRIESLQFVKESVCAGGENGERWM